MLSESTSPTSFQSFTLSDSRTLSYTAYGELASHHAALFYFHGFPASRLEGALWSDAAKELSLRIIAVDRPGMGRSTFQPNRTLQDWPADIVELADHLHIDNFKVLAVSGGGPYALACSKCIPPERLIAVEIVSGLYPPKLGLEGMLWGSRILLYVASWSPWVVEKLMGYGLGSAAGSENPKVFEDSIMQNLKGIPEIDEQCILSPSVKPLFLDSIRESFQNGSQGIAWEAKLFGCPWGFELEEVPGKHLTLWHGSLDANVPIRMAREGVKLIEEAQLKEFEGEGHISLPVGQVKEILQHLKGGLK